MIWGLVGQESLLYLAPMHFYIGPEKSGGKEEKERKK